MLLEGRRVRSAVGLRRGLRDMRFSGELILAGGLMVAAAGASAATIDFTSNATYATRSAAEASGSVGGVGFTVTGSRNALTYTGSGAPGAVGSLLGQNDGIGIGDDEIGGSEYVTVTFDREVRLTGLYFLDLFRAQDGTSSETVSAYLGTPPTGANFFDTFSATETYAVGGTGYGAFGVSVTGSVFTFDVGTGNDAVGIGDFALAGMDVAMVPLPAGALLLGTALFGLGWRRRR